MTDWFEWLSTTYRLDAATAAALDADGIAIVEGPVPPSQIDDLAEAYDQAVEAASEPDKRVGATTTRVHDLVNRGSAFDGLCLHAPALAAACQTIGRPFKLSHLLARTVHPRIDAQELHVDFAPDHDGWPMLGFIVMIDDFTLANGATRFVRGSHRWLTGAGTGAAPAEEAPHDLQGEPVCGPRATMILYNGSVVHGHGPNRTDRPRRSIQGAFVRRDAAGFGLAERMSPATRERIGPLAAYLIVVESPSPSSI
jgi:ectoine hydroxylase-related dioxygenase (phytanoyl-CoA dioxygenase family)